MKIWSTKYCLTEGIIEHEIDPMDANNSLIVIPKNKCSCAVYLHGEGRDWHKCREDAVLRADEIRIRKLKSLDRQIKTISAISFDS